MLLHQRTVLEIILLSKVLCYVLFASFLSEWYWSENKVTTIRLSTNKTLIMNKQQLILTKNSNKNLLFVIFIILFIYPVYCGLQIASIGAAYKAKLLCTNTFFAGRDPEVVLHEDLSGPERFIFSDIDYSNKSVSTWFPGIKIQQAFYLKGLGCVWSADMAEKEFRAYTKDWVADSSLQKKVSNSSLVENFTHPSFNQQYLKTAIDNAFLDVDLDTPALTRAVLVLYQGQLIAERYAHNISKDTPLQGWSMTKSVINALVGILVKQGKLSISQAAPIEEWSKPNDPRSKITLDHLLRMSSGLEFDESAGAAVTDLSEMLFLSHDAAAFAIAKPLIHQPDSHWQYASGTSNIISRIVRKASGGSTADVVRLLNQQLFIPLGINKALIEPDTSGNLIGSSYMYATARDWARFGQLYLQEGIWQGKRLLPQGWVKYSSTPTSAAPKGQFAAHFWSNGGIDSTPQNRPFPSIPGDLYYAAGYKGQRVIIIPSQELVIVRLGWTDDANPKNMETMVSEILMAKIN